MWARVSVEVGLTPGHGVRVGVDSGQSNPAALIQGH